MADVSLDDYINKKNLTVQIRNVGATNRSGLKSGFAKGKIKFQKMQQGNTRGQLKSPKNFQFRKKGQLSLQTKKNAVMSLQTRKNRGLQDRSTNMKNISVSIPNKNVAGFNQKTFDARDKIAKRPLDARERLAAKTKLTDARARIQQKKGKQSNTGKVVITGLNTTSSRQNNTQITRTFSQKPLGGVQMSGNSISITRNIGNSQEDTYQQNDQENSAGNFKITRTLHGNPRSGIQMSGNSISITRNVSNTQNVKMSNNRGPVIELRNDSYGISAPTDEDYDEYYSQPSSQIHTTEKTLTVKLPQSSKPQQIPVITSKPPIKLGNVAVKRKAPAPISFETAAPVSGPLKLAGGPLKLGGGPLKFAKSTMVADSVGVVKKPKIIKQDVRMEIVEAEEPAAPVVNSIQGFKVNITNLHPVVSQDDITELFGSVGTMKRARLVREGVAEVVYLQRDDATKAIQKYHNRELDGIPMQVKLMVPKPAPVPKPVMATPVADESPNGEPLKLFKGTSKTSQESNIESSTLHRALFKTGVSQQPSKLVTFTVKI